MSRLAAISVDLDSLPHYCRIQGLDERALDDRARRLVGAVAVPRLLELFASVGTKATFFVIGDDLADDTLCAALKGAHAQGVELANHSAAHDYAMSRWDPAAIAADLRRAQAALEERCGVKARGFRAPGYTLSSALLQALVEVGFAYDSSAFPAAPYYLAKAAVMAALAAAGRPSRAVLDSPKVLLAPRQPYRPGLGAPYSRGDAPLLELPLSVTPLARLPFIGTYATSMPWPAVDLAFRALRRDRLFNFELHALDVLDPSDGVPKALARQQRDLLVPVAEKLRRLHRLCSWLGEDRERVTLSEAARRLGGV